MSWVNPVFPIDAKNSIGFFVQFFLGQLGLVGDSDNPNFSAAYDSLSKVLIMYLIHPSIIICKISEMQYVFVLYFYSTLCRAKGYYSEKREKDYYCLWCKGTPVVNLLPLTSFLPSTLLLCIIHRWTKVTATYWWFQL